MKTKILSVLFTAAMILTLFPAFTVWGDDYSITLSLPDGSILTTASFNLSYTLEGPDECPPWPLVRRVGPVPIICSANSFVTDMNDVDVTSITQSSTTENGFLLTVEGSSVATDKLSSIDVKSLDVRDGVVHIELRDYNTNIVNIGTTPTTWSVKFEISNELLGNVLQRRWGVRAVIG